MQYTETKFALVLSFLVCLVNTFTVIFTPAIVPFLIASHTSWRGQSVFSMRTHLVTLWSAAGAAAGAGSLHAVTAWKGKAYLKTVCSAMPYIASKCEGLIEPTGQVSEWLEKYGAFGCGFAAFFPGPMQPAIIIAALLKCSVLMVVLWVFVGRYAKNFILFEGASRSIQGSLSVGKTIAEKAKKS
jgi:membrane protein DedA with SNARE-associated domain